MYNNNGVPADNLKCETNVQKTGLEVEIRECEHRGNVENHTIVKTESRENQKRGPRTNV